jgi:hypothetical protein
MTDPGTTHLRPFFPTALDFSAATSPHFSFLVDELGFEGPLIVGDSDEAFDVRFDGPKVAVLLSWEVEGGFFACQIIPRTSGGQLETDYERWLSPTEVLAARGKLDDATTQADLDDVDEAGYARVMKRAAANMRRHCAEVLKGDWSIYSAAHRWLERRARAE